MLPVKWIISDRESETWKDTCYKSNKISLFIPCKQL